MKKIFLLLGLVCNISWAKNWAEDLDVSAIEIHKNAVFAKSSPFRIDAKGCVTDKVYNLIKVKKVTEQFVQRSLIVLLEARREKAQISFYITECKDDYAITEVISLGPN